MRSPVKSLAPLVVAVLLALPGAAVAGPATNQLHGRIDRVLTILVDPELAKPSRTAERRAAIRGVAGEIFDFTEISKRSLARHWLSRTPAEREEFARLFADLLERAYVSKLELYSGEKVEYAGEVADAELVTVRTRIVTKQGTPIPVDYRMFQQNGQWRAYDVLIEGVSLVGNYRSQFNAVIQRSSYEGLVKTLRVKAQESPSGPPVAKSVAAPGADEPVAAPVGKPPQAP